MSQTVCIVWKHILSQVRVSVWPSNFFIREKHPKLSRIPPRTRDCLFEWSTDWPFMVSGAGETRAYLRHSWPHTDPSTTWMVTAVGGCVRARASVCVYACVHDVFTIYDNIIWPMLIMIIIKTNILYFIQIRHTDDFPSTGTRLVSCNLSCPILPKANF